MKITKDDIVYGADIMNENLYNKPNSKEEKELCGRPHIRLEKVREVVTSLLEDEVLLWDCMAEEYNIPKLMFRGTQRDKLKEAFNEILE